MRAIPWAWEDFATQGLLFVGSEMVSGCLLYSFGQVRLVVGHVLLLKPFQKEPVYFALNSVTTLLSLSAASLLRQFLQH